MANDLGLTVATVFAGLSVFYVVMGLLAPSLARFFARYGARPVMIGGAVLSACGFALLAAQTSAPFYFLAWAVLGAAGSAQLSTAAYIVLGDAAGQGAKSAIGALMLLTGLSGSVFLPVTAFLMEAVGWRGMCLVYAALMIFICLPLYVFALPRKTKAGAPVSSGPEPGMEQQPERKSTFALITLAISLNAFVTYGFSAILVDLLRAEGLQDGQAVAFGSALGVVQVAARLIDVIGGRRWDGLTTGVISGAVLVAAMLMLMAGRGSHAAVVGFLLCYGIGSGAFAVARATIPLTFYSREAFTRATSRIALPLNLMCAIAPPVLAGLLARFGSGALLALTTACSLGALACLLALRKRRPAVS